MKKLNKYWFKPRSFGWGFTPITWEGWVATLVLLGMIGVVLFVNEIYIEPVTLQKQLRFLLDFALVIIIFSILAAKKTNGKLKWRWGRVKK